jgi:hypothetical protein
MVSLTIAPLIKPDPAQLELAKITPQVPRPLLADTPHRRGPTRRERADECGKPRRSCRARRPLLPADFAD